jgi:hypothetical protein
MGVHLLPTALSPRTEKPDRCRRSGPLECSDTDCSTIMTQDTETQILVELRTISTRLDEMEAQTEKFNDRFSNYQQATQWVVQLSFSLIAAATIVTLASSIFKR